MGEVSTLAKQAKLGQAATARVLRKHVATVHVSAPLTLKERITVNVLLANAMEQGMDAEGAMREHSINLSQLNSLVFGDEENRIQIKRTLEGLLKKTIEWSYTDEKERKRWGASTWLAGYDVMKGVVYYSYSTQIAEKILDPAIFARLNFSIQHEISSRHSQALYENCARYRERGETKIWTLDTFRALMSIPDSYHQFKALNRDVIKPAVKEINEKTEIFIEPVLMKEGHTYSKILFRVNENTSYSGPIMPALTSYAAQIDPKVVEQRTEVYERLVAFGVEAGRAGTLLNEFDDDYINENLDIVAKRLQSGGSSIGNSGGYAVNALKFDYRDQNAPDLVEQSKYESPEKKAERKQEAKDQEDSNALWAFNESDFPRWRVQQWQASLTEAELNEYRNQFWSEKVRTNMLTKRLWDSDPKGKPITAIWTAWAKDKILEEPTNAERHKAAKELGVPLDELHKRVAEIRGRSAKK